MRLSFRARVSWPVLVLFALLVPPGQAQEPKLDPAATRDFAVADGLERKQFYAEAIERWKKFIQAYANDPRLASAHNHLGICQLQERKYSEAAVTFRTVLTKFPKFESLDAAQFNLGLTLYNVGLDSGKATELKEAAQAFAQVPARFAKSKQIAAALYYEGECYYQAGELAAAVAAYAKAIAAKPEADLLADAYYALGTAQQELKKAPEAAATFRLFLKQFPKHSLGNECRLRLAQSLFDQKFHAEAAPIFGQVAAVPDFADADFALMQQAQCLYEQNQPAQAASLYESLTKKFPKSKHAGLALLAAGKCWYQAEKFAEAQAILARVDVKTPEGAESGYWLGQTLIRLDKPAEALAVLERTSTAHSQSSFLPQIALARATALYEVPERRKEAVTAYADFAAKYPQHELVGRAVCMAALAALEVEDYATALRHAEAFLNNRQFDQHELKPKVLFIAAESRIQSVKPDFAAAERLYRQLLADHPRHPHVPQARLRIGLRLYRTGKHTEAVTHLTEAIAGLEDTALRAEAHLLLGRTHQDAGRTAEAIDALQQALQTRPDWSRSDEVLLALAGAQRAHKQFDAAAAQLRRLVEEQPKSPYRIHAFYQLGEIAHEQGRYDEATAQYDRVVSQAPKSEFAPLALYGSGLAWAAKKDDERAVQAFTKLITAHPESKVAARARYRRGLAYQRLKQFESATPDLTAFVASKPAETDALDARYALALCQSGLKQHEQAAATLSALVQDKPNYPQADRVYYELAFALLAARKQREAMGAFRQLTEKLPDSPLAAESWFRLGEYHETAREPAEALRAYTAGLAKTRVPELREKLQYKLGWVQYGQGKFGDAAAVLQQQIKEHPRGELYPDAIYLAGECLFRQNKFQQAEPLFAQVVAAKDKKHLARALYRQGACHAGIENWSASQQAYLTLTEQFPEFELLQEARYGLGWALQHQDKVDEARAVYERVTKAVNTETAAKCRFMIGEIAFLQKKYKEAVGHFLETALGYPYEEWQALGYFEAGRCLIELKEPQKAIDTFETLLKKFPDHPKARDAATLLADLKKRS